MRSPARVLLIEDDADIVALVKGRFAFESDFELRIIDHDFEGAASTETFRDADAVVLDLWITPNGFNEDYPMARQLLRCAKRYDPMLPVILFSAVVGLHHTELESEADAVVHKPHLDRLVKTLATLTGRWPLSPGGSL